MLHYNMAFLLLKLLLPGLFVIVVLNTQEEQEVIKTINLIANVWIR